MEVDGTVNSDLSFMSAVSLMCDLQVLLWYFKKQSKHSDRFAEMQLKSDTIGLSGGNFFRVFMFFS